MARRSRETEQQGHAKGGGRTSTKRSSPRPRDTAVMERVRGGLRGYMKYLYLKDPETFDMLLRALCG
jgi:hypothetical protein